jgi:hypothetical protein
MRKIVILFILMCLMFAFSSCADVYMVETVYGRPYHMWYQEPYSRVVISSVPPKYPPRRYSRKPYVEYRHYQPQLHAMPPFPQSPNNLQQTEPLKTPNNNDVKEKK